MSWSQSWKSSEKPGKQRKYRENAPLHVKGRLVSANLSGALREELGERTMPVRVGDRAKVMRGDDAGAEGIVSGVDREDEKLTINDLETERNDGTLREKPIHVSNVQLQALNLEDPSRVEGYGVEDFSEIQVEEEELEELEEEEEENEMMQRMQSANQEEYDRSEDEEEASEGEQEASEESENELRPQEVVEGNIDEVKEAVEEGLDPESVLEAEKDGKDRKTLVEWLEKRIEE